MSDMIQIFIHTDDADDAQFFLTLIRNYAHVDFDF